MKRDLELVRKLLKFFEEKEDPGHIKAPPIDGYDGFTVQYHLALMYEAGFLHAEPQRTDNGRVISVIPFNLSWDGHEFLDRVRSESVWRKIREKSVANGGSLAFAVIQAIALKLAMQEAGIGTEVSQPPQS